MARAVSLDDFPAVREEDYVVLPAEAFEDEE